MFFEVTTLFYHSSFKLWMLSCAVNFFNKKFDFNKTNQQISQDIYQCLCHVEEDAILPTSRRAFKSKNSAPSFPSVVKSLSIIATK